MLTYQVFWKGLNSVSDHLLCESKLDLDMLQMLFGYRCYDYRRCPTSFMYSMSVFT